MDNHSKSSFLLLSNEELLELYKTVSKHGEIGSEFITLVEEELQSRNLMLNKNIQND